MRICCFDMKRGTNYSKGEARFVWSSLLDIHIKNNIFFELGSGCNFEVLAERRNAMTAY